MAFVNCLVLSVLKFQNIIESCSLIHSYPLSTIGFINSSVSQLLWDSFTHSIILSNTLSVFALQMAS